MPQTKVLALLACLVATAGAAQPAAVKGYFRNLFRLGDVFEDTGPRIWVDNLADPPLPSLRASSNEAGNVLQEWRHARIGAACGLYGGREYLAADIPVLEDAVEIWGDLLEYKTGLEATGRGGLERLDHELNRAKNILEARKQGGTITDEERSLLLAIEFFGSYSDIEECAKALK